MKVIREYKILIIISGHVILPTSRLYFQRTVINTITCLARIAPIIYLLAY